MKKTLFCTAIAIAMACTTAYAEEVFTLGQIEVIADKSTDLSTTRINHADLQKNNQIRLSDVAKTTPGVFLERSGACSKHNLLVRGFDARRVPIFILLSQASPVYWISLRIRGALMPETAVVTEMEQS